VGQYGYSLLTGQPVADNKIGTAAADSVTYSSLTSVNPTNVALGVLATGALGSVVYSALTSGNLATSAASLATGAVSAIRRNDLVVAASDMLGIDDDPDPSQVTWVYDYYTDYDADYRYNGLHAPLPQYQDMDYREYPGGRHYYQTLFTSNHEMEDRMETSDSMAILHDSIRPVYNPTDEREDTNAPEPITAQPDMFSGEVMDVTSSRPSSNIPYIVYSNEQNPWSVMEDGEDTDHLYKRLGQSSY